MRKSLHAWPLCLALVFNFMAFGQTAPDGSDINSKIRAEETQHSEIMRTMHFLSDVYGPRLTGSPNAKAAAVWAVARMKEWGFENAHLEPWDFGHPGWVNERLSAYIVSPVHARVTCEVLAWTPGTKGTVTAEAVQLTWPDRPTQEELSAALAGFKDKVRGKIVLAGRPQVIQVSMETPTKRLTDEQAAERFDPDRPARPRPTPTPTPQGPPRLTGSQLNEQVDKFLVGSGALVRVNDAAMDHGEIRAFNNRTYDLTKAPPTVVMRNEDYGRVSRLLADGSPVRLEFNIVNRTFPAGRTSYNAVGEIPGTDRRDEVVMLGAHLDSWHAATGATDNAIGCAVMMEAARILKSLGVKPRRTIRVALWTGEEEGLLGSQAYVKQHFGSAEKPKPEFSKLDAYFNIDAGTGRARGASVFGPPEAATVLREALVPFKDLFVVGAVANTSRSLGGSDHTSFNQAGLPGVSFGQDPIEYFAVTWHTNLDTYERIIETDARTSATVIAAAAYQLATRDEMLPRFTREKMPPPPTPTPTPSPTPARP